MKTIALFLLYSIVSISAGASELPAWEDVQNLLGQPIASQEVQKFVASYRLKQYRKFDEGGFDNYHEMPFSLLYRRNTIDRVIFRISIPPGKTLPVYTAKLPHGIQPTDTPELVIERLGKPTHQPYRDYLNYEALRLTLSFDRDTHILTEIDLDSK